MLNENDLHLNSSGDSMKPLGEKERRCLQGLLNDLCEGRLSDSQARQLGDMLAACPQARDLYIRYLHLHASLASSGATARETPPIKVYPLSPMQRLAKSSTTFSLALQDWPVRRIVATISAVAAMLAITAWYLVGGFQSVLPEYDRNRVRFVAQVIADADCQWGEQTAQAVQGGLLKVDDRLDLIAGIAKIRFDSGGEVVLRGPAELRVDSGMSCYLVHGELSADVPPVAHGFTVHTPLGQVVDLGTQFGVNVGDEIEVQVFEGECELHPNQSPSQKASSQGGKSPIGLLAGATSKFTLDQQESVVRVVDLNEPTHEFARTLPEAVLRSTSLGLNFLAVDSFGQGGVGTRVVGRNGGFGWSGPWLATEDSNNISFLLGNGGAMSRGTGDGVVERRLGPGLAMEQQLYFSAEFQLDGDDPLCSAWLELFKFVPHMWSNGDTNLAVIGITDGHFSGRLSPFGSREEEQKTGNCGRYQPGTRYLVVGKLEFNAVGDQERLSVWVNPTEATESEPNKIILRDTGQPGADAVAIRCWELEGGSAFATVGEIRVGRTWLSVIQ